jgi:hypothetical protein
LVTQKIQGLDTLVNLEELWLGKNKIAKLEVMTGVGKLLARIDVSSFWAEPGHAEAVENPFVAVQSNNQDRGIGRAGEPRGVVFES